MREKCSAAPGLAVVVFLRGIVGRRLGDAHRVRTGHAFFKPFAQASFPLGPSVFYVLACEVLGHPPHAFLLMDGPWSSPAIVSLSVSSAAHLAASIRLPRPLQAIQKDAGRRQVGQSGRIDAT
jgi:hypothetical protein